jgi:hypothetical protein
MLSMRPARSAVFLQRQLFRGLFSVFSGSIVLALALIASKSDKLPHGRPLSSFLSNTTG